MRYNKQAIVVLDEDLKETGRAIHAKDAAAGGTKSHVMQSAKEKPNLDGNSRLYVLAHGVRVNAGPVACIGKLHHLSAKKLAQLCAHWLNGTKIKRISLHICNAAGTRGLPEEHPKASFAYEFAKHCGGLTEEISARTGAVNGDQVATRLRGVIGFERTVGGRRHAEGDKVVYFTDGESTIDQPKPPTRVDYSWKDGRQRMSREVS